eukprot:COSAG02_NODE_241_length_27638_cov_13.101020_9_plen_87_part_00
MSEERALRWGGRSREVTGQADIIAYGSQAVGGSTNGVDAEAICVTCADHTPGEEVHFDPLGKVTITAALLLHCQFDCLEDLVSKEC